MDGSLPNFLFPGSFSNDGINEFLRDLSYGKGRTSPVKGAQIPKIDTIEAWDGKDGELPVEEDIDLSDVELDDLDKDELWLWKRTVLKFTKPMKKILQN